MQKVVRTLALVAALFPAGAFAQGTTENRYSQKEKADLTELLTSGLKVRTSSEKAYIAGIVEKVEKGELSESLVKAIFQRARQRHSRYPLPYFTVMLQQAAKLRGVTL
jgi:hypothetical protein